MKKTVKMPELIEWTSASNAPVPRELEAAVERLRTNLELNFDVWNEMDLRTMFIGPIISLVHFQGEGFSSFSNRTISAIVGEYEIFGEADWMVATGRAEPESPFFFLHEYKRDSPEGSEPMAQLLAAMSVARVRNGGEHPVYGCLVSGCIWRFVLLCDKRYGVSVSYDAADPTELPAIWSILSETKNRIVARVAQLQSSAMQTRL
ncbi:MAG: hypothetical protein NZ534_10870 [Bacteroidia bacterium]|nr:hypothetical protein [Bacteroidia bacterium]